MPQRNVVKERKRVDVHMHVFARTPTPQLLEKLSSRSGIFVASGCYEFFGLNQKQQSPISCVGYLRRAQPPKTSYHLSSRMTTDHL